MKQRIPTIEEFSSKEIVSNVSEAEREQADIVTATDAIAIFLDRPVTRTNIEILEGVIAKHKCTLLAIKDSIVIVHAADNRGTNLKALKDELN
ncbi:MAG: hypothetical protein WC979_01980 [Candidatus Pacearchaeota archaeon]|jgi:hypothetical protein|nr:hypothetical protein [Clostridia bacterium]